jgi:lipoprotein-anchoring transpeptidase ErfK/SrfK
LFIGEGVAIHSTFWHNDYGTPRSHGCVNASSEDAKWVFRWTAPHVDYTAGDLTIQGASGTPIIVTKS